MTAGAAETARLAGAGRDSLQTIDNTMRQLAQSTGSISSRLAVINEKADSINLAVTTITKVSEQTNMLSINAAIEAEKAGEQGMGFLVVAREIRRLADQTAVATLDIERIVKQMQTAVSAGVTGMDRFAEEVRSSIGTVGQTGSPFGQIISQVQSLSGRIEQVNEAMSSQSQGAAQISDAMTRLSAGAQQSAAALEEFNQATTQLRDAVHGLTAEISSFQIDD